MEIVYFEGSTHLVAILVIQNNVLLRITVMEDYRIYMGRKRDVCSVCRSCRSINAIYNMFVSVYFVCEDQITQPPIVVFSQVVIE
jgi:hypothetical protein